MNTEMPDGQWCLYLLECRNGSLYAGITNHLQDRYTSHLSGNGAKFTRANPPVRIIGARPYPDRATASAAEYKIKRLSKAQKIAFILDSL